MEITTTQISDIHQALVNELGHGIDPARVRRALEAAGWTWVNPCPHTTMRQIQYGPGRHRGRYICATDSHPECHLTFEVLPTVDG